MKRRIVVLSLGLLIGLTTTGQAQVAELDSILHRLASSWARGDAHTLAAYSSRGGVSLELDGEAIGPLTRRQVSAVLRGLFVGRKTDSLRPGLARVVGGQPPRAFGEFAWIVRTQGTTVPERATIFLALVWEGERWQITQIRLLR